MSWESTRGSYLFQWVRVILPLYPTSHCRVVCNTHHPFQLNVTSSHNFTMVQHLANYQFQWVEDKFTYATCLQKLPRSARTVILVDDKQRFPVAHQLKQLGITVFPHPPLPYDQYIFTCALSCFQQGTYQVLVTTPATHCPELFKGIATHVIVDCIISMAQFWDYLTVMGPESGTVTTCISHA